MHTLPGHCQQVGSPPRAYPTPHPTAASWGHPTKRQRSSPWGSPTTPRRLVGRCSATASPLWRRSTHPDRTVLPARPWAAEARCPACACRPAATTAAARAGSTQAAWTSRRPSCAGPTSRPRSAPLRRASPRRRRSSRRAQRGSRLTSWCRCLIGGWALRCGCGPTPTSSTPPPSPTPWLRPPCQRTSAGCCAAAAGGCCAA